MSGLKRLLPIIQQQKTRDVSEADTVTLVKDVMAEVFGFDKYTDLTSEHEVRGTYCDLAVRIDQKPGEKPIELVEVKSAGTTLEDRHVKQAIDYAANAGVDWVVLTNGSHWRLYEVLFAKSEILVSTPLQLELHSCSTKEVRPVYGAIAADGLFGSACACVRSSAVTARTECFWSSP